MPRLVIIIDEFADLMKQDQRGIGDKICMLAQKSRAAGIHLVLVAQRPSADIVEGPIKSNLPARLVFKASSKTDSLVSLGATGAETLVGRGDCLYKTATMLNIERARARIFRTKRLTKWLISSKRITKPITTTTRGAKS